MTSPSLAITIRSFDLSGELLQQIKNEFSVTYMNLTGERLKEDELIRAVRNAEFVIAGTETFSKRVLESSSHLKVISRVGVGTDSIDAETAVRLGIEVLNTPESPVTSVAEHTLALLLAIMKRIPQYNTQMRHGDQSVVPGMQLSGKTVGIVGLGRIGFRVASILSDLGCSIQFYDPFMKGSFPSQWKHLSTLDDLFKTSDILSLHAPPNKDGKPLIGSRVIENAKPGLILINTSRGSLIDENSLEVGLKNGLISAAGLDVFVKEPYSGALLKYPQVIVTPHVASNTRESRHLMESESVENIILAKRRLSV